MFWHKDKLKIELSNSRKQLEKIENEKELNYNKNLIESHLNHKKYDSAESSVKSRMDAEYEAKVKLESNHRRDLKKIQEQRIKSSIAKSIDSEGLSLLALAKQQPYEKVKIHAVESVWDNISEFPYTWNQVLDIRNLMQIPTLIRELWPYKEVNIRTIQMLDFARWICRVVVAECPHAVGIIRGKCNYVVGGKGFVHKIVCLKDSTDKEKVKKYQKIIDDFHDANNFPELEREIYKRTYRDGEAFVWFKQHKNRASEVACVEPDYIRPSMLGAVNQEDPHISHIDAPDWSFGILTEKHAYHTPIAYQFVWNDQEEQIVNAKDVFHTRLSMTQNSKRCLPPFLVLADDLIRLTILRKRLADSSQFRASIGGVVKFEVATPRPKTWNDAMGNDYNQAGMGNDGYFVEQHIDSSTNLLQLPPGRDFVQAPMAPDSAAMQTIYDWHIQACAQALQLPEWMVQGSSSGSSFADSFTAESPSVKEFESEKFIFCRNSRKMDLRELEAKLDIDIEDWLEDYDVEVTGDSVITRDEKSETETHIMLIDKRVESIQTARTLLGMNSEFEAAQIVREAAEHVGPSEILMAESKAAPRMLDKIGAEPETTSGKQQQLGHAEITGS